ncbi:D-beta-hydroxybutyrate dehydrogenase, mitochondrial [Chionoecetes opilio]|uniref:D-beta-hydroxybutyrate dehydrogenase, mitochondrial n=1 Tax=Chionoecetes opilio TaxID=41210 RepID=A0A8J4YEB2_CHIOP|nr:D-beta-hydroxybutyrate dehydrogenase, mitochondrial [Chionoecetes opilio]
MHVLDVTRSSSFPSLQGFRVMAGCLALDGEGANQLRASASPRLHTIQLDVTSTDEVGRAVQEVEDLILEGEVLWAVVNNAGLSTFGEVEWVQEHTFRKILDVNVMGMVAVTKAFLPFIRQAKGRVVNMASMYGRMGNVMRGPYVLSKYAVEGFTDCLSGIIIIIVIIIIIIIIIIVIIIIIIICSDSRIHVSVLPACCERIVQYRQNGNNPAGTYIVATA